MPATCNHVFILGLQLHSWAYLPPYLVTNENNLWEIRSQEKSKNFVNTGWDRQINCVNLVTKCSGI